MVYALLQEIEGFKVRLPQGAFYFFPDVSALYGKRVPTGAAFTQSCGKEVISNSIDLCNYLLYDANVAVVQGVAFGDDNCIRLSYATDEAQLREACRRIKEAIAQLQ
jgi:aspartate aminotransferase